MINPFKKLRNLATSQNTQREMEAVQHQQTQDWPGVREGFLYFFGIIDNPYEKKLKEIQRDIEETRITIKKSTPQSDAESLRRDWEAVGDALRWAMNTFEDEHPELKRNTSQPPPTGQQIWLYS